MSLKKLAIILLASALLVLSAGALAGCGKSADATIKDDMTRQLDGVKKMDGDFANSLVSAFSTESFEVYGIDPAAFVQSYFQGFDYSIGEIKVDGDTATVELTLTCKSYSAIKVAIGEATAELNGSDEFASLPHDEQYERIGQIVMEALDSATPLETKPITVRYTKKDDSWLPTDNTAQAIAKALRGN